MTSLQVVAVENIRLLNKKTGRDTQIDSALQQMKPRLM